MSLPLRRRPLRRHSISTLQNVSKNTKAMITFDAGSAIGNRVLKGRISKKRLSLDERSLHQDENNEIMKNQNDKINRVSNGSTEKQNCELSSLGPLARLSEFPGYDKKDNISSMRSKDVYESLMDMQHTLEEIEPDLRRRSGRHCVVNKQNTMSPKSSQENVNSLTVRNIRLRKNRRKSTNFEEEKFDVTQVSNNKRRKLSLDDTLQYNNDFLYPSVISEPTNSLKKMDTQNFLSGSDPREIEKYYVDKSISNTTSLETIFEENSNSNKAMGKRKKKRFIPFPEILENKTRKNNESMMKLNSRRKKSVDVALQSILSDDID